MTYTVLLYHGVHADDLDLGSRNSSGKHVCRSRFASEMRYLRDHCDVVTMRHIASAHCRKMSIPDRAVAVTFDDGFWNNYTEAWQVLEEFDIPATIYLATGFIGTERIIWTDRLEAALLNTRVTQLSMDYDSVQRKFPLGSLSERLSALHEVKRLCKRSSAIDIETIVSAVEAQADSRADPSEPLYRFMNWDEVREMSRSPLIDFGAHTIDHVALGRADPDEMRQQIDGSVAKVADEIGHCDLFSYPEGQPGDYNDDVIRHLKLKGFDHAPSAIAGLNSVADTDPFHIRRIMMGFNRQAFPFSDHRYNA